MRLKYLIFFRSDDGLLNQLAGLLSSSSRQATTFLGDFLSSKASQGADIFGNFTPPISDIFENFSAAKTRNDSAKSNTPISDRERRSVIENRVPKNNESEVGRKMAEQSLLASAIFLEFWRNCQFPELKASEEKYSVQLCRIEKSLEKIGPWAVLTGRSLFQGLKKFPKNLELSLALKNDFGQLCNVQKLVPIDAN